MEKLTPKEVANVLLTVMHFELVGNPMKYAMMVLNPAQRDGWAGLQSKVANYLHGHRASFQAGYFSYYYDALSLAEREGFRQFMQDKLKFWQIQAVGTVHQNAA